VGLAEKGGVSLNETVTLCLGFSKIGVTKLGDFSDVELRDVERGVCLMMFAVCTDSRSLSVRRVMKLRYAKAVLHAKLLGESKRRWENDMNMEFHISVA
jgi:hypothetical protein